MKKYFVGGLLPFLILFGLSYGLIKAADVEIILGTSSAFNVVRGTDVSSGTKLYVGSSTVSIGTTTQNAMFYVAGSSTSGNDASLRVRNSSGVDTLSVRNDGAILIGTNTSTLNSALYVGSATSGSLGTITAGFLSMGTISANTSLHGTTTVRFLADIFANGTITTGTKFVGDGSLLTGITATGGVTGGNISTSGTISAGSTTVSTLTTTGSATVSNTLTAASNTFRADSGSVTVTTRVGIGTSTPSSSYRLQVTDDADLGFVVGSSGSITAKTLTVTGSATVTGALTAASNTFRADSGSVTVTTRVGIGTSTPSSAYRLQVTDDADLGFVVGSSGSITAKTITSTGSITVSSNGTITAGFLSVGTVSASLSGHGTTTVRFLNDIFANGTITTGTKFVGDGSLLTGITATGGVTGGNISTSGTISAGSTTVSTLTTTGSATVSNTLTAASNTFRADSGSVTVTTRVGIGTSTPSSSYRLQVTDDADLGFVVGSSGSITAKTLTVTGSATVTGALTAASNTFRADSGSVTVTTRVGIGTSTPSSAYRLQVTDDADLGFVVGSSGSITAKTITSTGSITVSSNGTITAGFLSVGTVSASLSGHGTTTVRFLNDIFANGTITTGTKFVGDGSLLTGITATGGVTGGNISTSGTISAGSTTVSTLTTTGSATVSNTLTAASNTFRADSGSVTVTTRVGIGTSTPSSSYRLQVTDDADLGFVVGSSGSITAKTLTVTGSATVTGTLTAAVGAGSRVGIGTTTPSSAYMLQITDSSDLGVVVGSSGSITAKTITSTGSITVSNNGTVTAGFLSVGTITASVSLHGTTTVHFPGGINVTGPKNFLIPHPDPQKRDMGWVLRHSCIESPTRGDTLYRYKVEIESDGEEAFIDLPSYWLYLNENSEVWVSPVGQFAQGYGYVDEVLNKLVLKGEKKGFYNVLLIGTRKDQYAKAFDAKGVEYIDPAINELLTRGEKKGAGEIQLIDTQNDHVIKNFMDPIVDRFGLATHQ